MSSMVCQGLQSCLEPRFVEPRALALKMVTTKAHFLKPTNWAESLLAPDSESDTDENKKEDTDEGGWSFMQTLASIGVKENQEKPYVHPVYKHSASQLTTKSLELCTETLGSETGSDIGDDIDISISSSDSESSKSPTKERSRLRNTFLQCNKANYRSLPPPLTSISGSNCYSIKPHRENGRLVMKAVVVPTPNTCFQAERRDGRLKLHYIKKSSDNLYSSESSDSEQEQEQEAQVEEEDYLDEENDENNANAGGEFGKGKLQRPSRCNEGGRGNRGLLTWEPFWVAT